MELLRSLLLNLGRKWSQQPVEKPLLTIERNLGQHRFVTVEAECIHFHSAPYRDNLPRKETIYLQDYTAQELVNIINQMGYVATLSSEGQAMTDLKGSVLMEVKNAQLPATLMTFTSNNWKFLYPIYRLLKKANQDIDTAILNMYIPTARGEWLDYFATFFGVRRLVGEDDNRFVRRMLMRMFSPKINNVAMEEIIGFQLQGEVHINDIEPGLFEAVIDADLMGRVDETRSIIEDCKAGGIDYILRYAKTLYEDYSIYIADRYGYALRNMDNTFRMETGFRETQFGYRIPGDMLILNETELDFTPVAGMDGDDKPTDLGRFQVPFMDEVPKPEEGGHRIGVRYSEDPFPTPEESPMGMHVSVEFRENYLYGDETGEITTSLGSSELNGNSAMLEKRILESGSMTLIKDGEVIQTMTW